MRQIESLPTTDIQQMVRFARSRQSAKWLIDAAPYYYMKGVLLWIDPAIAFVQTCLETGNGNFPPQWCLIDASYKNTCGMKTTQGGADNDPNAHMRFKSWKDSIDAQYDHLALYAGLDGYPAKETKDPRHFPFICGTAKTIEDLKGRWASDKDYDIKINNLLIALQDS